MNKSNILTYKNYRSKTHDPTLRRLYESIDCARLFNTRYILDNALLNLSGIYGRTALSITCHIPDDKYKIRTTILGWLLEEKCDYNYQDEFGLTLINWTCKEHKKDIFTQLFRKHEMDIRYDISDENGDCPLMHAVRTGDLEFTKTLLQAYVQFGINVDLRNKQGMTSYAEAKKLRLEEMANLLVEVGGASILVKMVPEMPIIRNDHKFNDTLTESASIVTKQNETVTKPAMIKPNVIRIEKPNDSIKIKRGKQDDQKKKKNTTKRNLIRKKSIENQNSNRMDSIKNALGTSCTDQCNQLEEGKVNSEVQEDTLNSQLTLLSAKFDKPNLLNLPLSHEHRRNSSPATLSKIDCLPGESIKLKVSRSKSDKSSKKTSTRKILDRRHSYYDQKNIPDSPDGLLTEVSTVLENIVFEDSEEQFKGHPTVEIGTSYRRSCEASTSIRGTSPTPPLKHPLKFRKGIASPTNKTEHFILKKPSQEKLWAERQVCEDKFISLLDYQMRPPSTEKLITYHDLHEWYGVGKGTSSFSDVHWLLYMKGEQTKDSFVSSQKRILKPKETLIPRISTPSRMTTPIPSRRGSRTPKRMSLKQAFLNVTLARLLSGER